MVAASRHGRTWLKADAEHEAPVPYGRGLRPVDEPRISEERATVVGDSARKIGFITDPDEPQRVAEYLVERAPDRLNIGDDWKIELEVDPGLAAARDKNAILQVAGERRRERGWAYAICLTDLPVRHESRPVLGEANLTERAAVISLPALGGVQPCRRTRQVVQQMLGEFTTATVHRPDDDVETTSGQHGLDSALTRVLAPIHRTITTGDQGEVYIRYHATRGRGRARLLAGMVRTNRPWRLVFGLSRALAAAVAAGAFGLSSSTIWQIGDQLGTGWQMAAAVAATAVLVFWLVAAHQLWEHPTRTAAQDREQMWLYNASTVASLTIGVACLYLTLFLINLALAAFLVPSTLLNTTLGHPAEPTSYFALAWAFTTLGSIAGALGSSLETDEAVRQAAYGYREERRRAEHANATD